MTSHVYVEDTPQGARDAFYRSYSRCMGDNMAAARGERLPLDTFEAWAGPTVHSSPAARKR